MDHKALQELLISVKNGSFSIELASEALIRSPAGESAYAQVDYHRQLRQGMPEVVFGENKSVEQLIGIVSSLKTANQNVLITRVEEAKALEVCALHDDLTYVPIARTLALRLHSMPSRFERPVAIVTAGTSDQPVAEEAAETLMAGGAEVSRYFDVGVAGIHRLFDVLPELEKAPAVICIAGMEGALPSVLGGLLRAPVVAVPTSVGYGVAQEGMTALFGMLTGCAAGVTVVNIDNGFGAAMAVLRMSQLQSQRDQNS